MAAAAGKLNGVGSKAVTPEEMELSRLRAENAHGLTTDQAEPDSPEGSAA
jgi:hypothetical protein